MLCPLPQNDQSTIKEPGTTLKDAVALLLTSKLEEEEAVLPGEDVKGASWFLDPPHTGF